MIDDVYLLGSDDLRIILLKLVQFGLIHKFELDKRHSQLGSENKKSSREISITVYVPMHDELGGYVVCHIEDHHYGFVAERFHEVPPKGSWILDLVQSNGPSVDEGDSSSPTEGGEPI